MRNKALILAILCISLTIHSEEQPQNKTEITGETKSISEIASDIGIKIANLYPDYPATPGDIYEILYLSGTNINKTLICYIDNAYNIDLSFIGKVNVKDLNYSEVQQVLIKKIITTYPNSIVNVVIKDLGKFRVTLLGEVKESEIIIATSITMLSDVIQEKTTQYSSIRNIEIRSQNGDVAEYDFFQFTKDANIKNNPYLKSNDIITIKQYTRNVSISGAIKRPGKYELLDDDNLYDLIYTYGYGFTKVADLTRIKLTRKLNEKKDVEVESLIINSKIDNIENFILRDFDSISIPEVLTEEKSVTISGEVKKPGKYVLSKNDTLYDLIYTYGYGFTKFAETKQIEIQRRIGKNETYSESTIYINTEEDKLQSITLNDYDIVTILNKITYSPTVIIQGAVSSLIGSYAVDNSDVSPGNNVSNKIIIPIIKGNKISTTLRKMNGVFNLTSDLENAFILRDNKKIEINLKNILAQINSNDDIVVHDKDIIIIPFRQLQVFV